MRALLAVLLAVGVSGCMKFGGDLAFGDPACGPESEVGLDRDDTWSAATASQRQAYLEGEMRVFSWTIAQDIACKDQHIPYSVYVLISDGPSRSTGDEFCSESKELVRVKEFATAGRTVIPILQTGSTESSTDYRYHSDFGLAQAANHTGWALSLEVLLDSVGNVEDDTRCAHERIEEIQLKATSKAVPG